MDYVLCNNKYESLIIEHGWLSSMTCNWSAMDVELSIMDYQISVMDIIRYPISMLHYQWYNIAHGFSTINYPLSVLKYELCIINFQMFIGSTMADFKAENQPAWPAGRFKTTAKNGRMRATSEKHFFPPLSDVWVLVLNVSRPPSSSSFLPPPSSQPSFSQGISMLLLPILKSTLGANFVSPLDLQKPSFSERISMIFLPILRSTRSSNVAIARCPSAPWTFRNFHSPKKFQWCSSPYWGLA